MTRPRPHRRAAALSQSQKIKDGIRRAQSAGRIMGANGRILAAQNRQEAARRATALLHVLEEFSRTGASYRQMVVRLNARGEASPGGTGRWHIKTLQRLVARARQLDPLVVRSSAALAQAHALDAAHRDVRARTKALLADARRLLGEMRQLAPRRARQGSPPPPP
jgi:hypothetical protein